MQIKYLLLNMEVSENICRICLDSNAFISMVENDTSDVNTQHKLHHKLFACTSVQLSPDDTITKKICQGCIIRLEDVHSFRQLAQTSDNLLRKRHGIDTIDYTLKCEMASCNISHQSESIVGQLKENHSDPDDRIDDTYNYYVQLDTLKIKEEPESENRAPKKPQKTKKVKLKNSLAKYKDAKYNKAKTKKKPKKTENQKTDLDSTPTLADVKLKVENNNDEASLITTKLFDTEADTDNAEDSLIDFEEVSECESFGGYLEDMVKNKSEVMDNIETRISADGRKKEYKCTICSHVYRYQSEFYKHMRIDHNIEGFGRTKELMCDVCGNTFHDPYGLRMHKRSHSGDRPFTCNVCGQGFTQQSNMERHISARHRKDKPFQCDTCSKRFAYSSTLREHVRAHRGEQRHQCAICARRFSRRFALRRHQLTHSRARPYACRHCARAYAQTNDLKAHVKRKHRHAATGKLADYCVKQGAE